VQAAQTELQPGVPPENVIPVSRAHLWDDYRNRQLTSDIASTVKARRAECDFTRQR